MQKYKKQPVEVEAVQYDGTNGKEIEKWSNSNVIESPVLKPTENNPTGKTLKIKTLEGVMTASVGDFIVKGIAGEFHPVRKDIFEKTYRKSEETIKLWVVGEVFSDHTWSVIGIFETEKDAIKSCYNKFCFIGPIELNKNFGKNHIDWPDAYFPLLKNTLPVHRASGFL